MSTKFEFTGEVKIEFGITLRRIRAKTHFGNVVTGEFGGWIEKETNLSHDGNAWVFGNAQVSGNTWVFSNAQVSGNAWVFGNARVFGNAWVFGNARVSGNAWVFGNARVSGNAQVSGNAWVFGNAQVSGNAWVFGNAWVYGDAQVDKRLITATRSDGYTFVCARTAKAPVIIAGCRYFTFDEARQHWHNTRSGTVLGLESLALVDHLERMATIIGWVSDQKEEAA